MTNGIGESSARAMEPSRASLIGASQAGAQVENELKRPLSEAKWRIQDIQGVAQDTKTKFESIGEELKKIRKTSDYGDLDKSIQVSGDAIGKADSALDQVDRVLSRLASDESSSKSLPITVSDLNKGVQVAENELNEAKDSVPFSSAITEGLEEKRPFFEDKKAQIGADIAELKARIQTARELANRVPVGMNFVESSHLLLGNPQSLDSQQVQTKISLFFKTEKPDGLILFIGNGPGKRAEASQSDSDSAKTESLNLCTCAQSLWLLMLRLMVVWSLNGNVVSCRRTLWPFESSRVTPCSQLISAQAPKSTVSMKRMSMMTAGK